MPKRASKQALPKNGAPRQMPMAATPAISLPVSASSGLQGGRWYWLSVLVLLTAGWLAYSQTFGGPLVFDDISRIRDNPALRSLWPLSGPMASTNRPLGMYTFAINYALHGYRVWGYHAVNLTIHLSAGWLLFGLAWRTLRFSERARHFRTAALPLALTIALVWLLHPLQTQAVTYVVQRLESLMSLCYLATLYAWARAQQSPRSGWWYVAAIVACAWGMGTKEIMLTAPLLVLWFDRVFWADSWRTLAGRWPAYLGLTASWGVLAWAMLQWSDDYASGSAVRVAGLGPLKYLLNESIVLVHYLRLCFWPVGQNFDYDWQTTESLGAILPALAAMGGLFAVTLWCLWRRPAWGFLGGCFFVILAPTSSVVPIRDLANEHRMYLASAAVIALGVLGCYAGIEWLGRRWPASLRPVRVSGVCLATGCALVLASLTYARNAQYADGITIWQDAMEKSPWNARAHSNYGDNLCQQERYDEAVEPLRRAVELQPDYVTARYNLGTALYKSLQWAEAIPHLRRAIELDPGHGDAHNNLGLLYCEQGRMLDGMKHLTRAVELNPQNGKFQAGLGTAYYSLGQYDQAIAALERAAALVPNDADMHYNLANALISSGQAAPAIEHYQRVLAIDPQFHMEAYVHYGLGVAHEANGQKDQAVAAYQQALTLMPEHANAQQHLNRLLSAGSYGAATAQY